LEAVEPGHLHVGQNEIRAFEACPREPVLPVCCFENAEALELQIDRAEQPSRGIVVDDQDAKRRPAVADLSGGAAAAISIFDPPWSSVIVDRWC
jgi:hypothetical protein